MFEAPLHVFFAHRQLKSPSRANSLIGVTLALADGGVLEAPLLVFNSIVSSRLLGDALVIRRGRGRSRSDEEKGGKNSGELHGHS